MINNNNKIHFGATIRIRYLICQSLITNSYLHCVSLFFYKDVSSDFSILIHLELCIRFVFLIVINSEKKRRQRTCDFFLFDLVVVYVVFVAAKFLTFSSKYNNTTCCSFISLFLSPF